MKRLLAIILLGTLLCACSAGTQQEAGFTFTDDLGRTVTVNSPRRVACLLGSFADVWHLAGGEICAAPDDAWVDLDLPLGEDTVNLGHTKQLSLEGLFAAEPELVIASANTEIDLAWMDTLDAVGIPTAYFDVSDFDDYLRMLKVCTDITGRPDLYEKHGLAVQEEIREAVESAGARGTAPKVLFLRASASSIRAKGSDGSVLGQMLKDLGCVNIADSDAALLENLSLEHILLEDPDHIFFVQLGDDAAGMRANIDRFLAGNPAWASLTAVQEGRVHILDKSLYHMKPNARWGEAYRKLEELLR